MGTRQTYTMKAKLFSTTLFAIFALPGFALAGDCCAPKPPPASPPACTCCEKMKSAAVAPTLEQLIANAKTAKDDQLLDALAAVLNRLIQERKTAQGAAPAALEAPAAPPGHQH